MGIPRLAKRSLPTKRWIISIQVVFTSATANQGTALIWGYSSILKSNMERKSSIACTSKVLAESRRDNRRWRSKESLTEIQDYQGVPILIIENFDLAFSSHFVTSTEEKRFQHTPTHTPIKPSWLDNRKFSVHQMDASQADWIDKTKIDDVAYGTYSPPEGWNSISCYPADEYINM